MAAPSTLDPGSSTPLYRQVYDLLREKISSGALSAGDRLPPTRELAQELGLNRTTVSAAYELLESEGLIKGHVGRGSFVCSRDDAPGERLISFANSRPSELLFPLDEFRSACAEVIASDQVKTILQLGSPLGYDPLRRYLLAQAHADGTAGDGDDLLITSGCQQALDLIQRTLVAPGDPVMVEDPVYGGLRNAFQRGSANLTGIPMGADGIDLDAMERALARERVRMIAVTPNFQNPTGLTIPAAARSRLLELAGATGALVIENDIYAALRYSGEDQPSLKRLDTSGRVILLGSFSKLAFPGLRVGWILGPAQLIASLTEAKQWSDLHSDQLSQAVLLRFAQSGGLARHRRRVLEAGAERLEATLRGCERHLPRGSEWTRPEGGMNVWARLPAPLDAGDLLRRAEEEGVAYLPARHFTIGRQQPGAFRLSFAGLTPAEIETGLEKLGRVFRSALEQSSAARLRPAPAIV